MEKIVIVGFGWVGQANALALNQMGYEVFYYDIADPKQLYEKHASGYGKIKRLQANQIRVYPPAAFLQQQFIAKEVRES